MRYYININNLEKKIEYMSKQLDVIEDCINKLESLKLQISWEGRASDIFKRKYTQYLNSLKVMQTKLVKCIGFFTLFYNGYSEDYIKLKNKYRELQNLESVK